MKKKLVLLSTLVLTLLYGCSTISSLGVSEDEVANLETSASVDTTEQEKEEESIGVSEDAEDVPVVPNYYNSVSDADETGVYLGGVGGIYRIDSESGVEMIYSAPHLVGAALYKNYIYFIEYNITDSSMTADLVRISKDGSGKEILTQINTGSYDLRIIGNMLVISDTILGDYGLETIFWSYTMDDKGNLISDIPQDTHTQFVLPNGYEDSMRLLINPWFSTEYYDYTCFTKAVGEIDINSIWISRGNQEALKEVVTCSGHPLLTGNTIFYCDSNEEALIQHYLESAQETVLYDISDSDSLSLLTYDDEWVYFLQKPRIDELNVLSSSIVRVNIQDHRTEKIYELLPGSYINNFSVYGNICYFILSDKDTTQWECCDLTNFTLIEIH